MPPSSFASTPSKRVLSLQDPSSKISKSSPDAFSCILLTDTSLQTVAKNRGAVAVSIQEITYNPVSHLGTSFPFSPRTPTVMLWNLRLGSDTRTRAMDI
ncbi:hypothetical protein JVT61DRAFT_2637 [Boletus reticuloceps]|uniref:Uncharacterized protein n=1 Tax=Boletus reticuloceps TaxID=495285 RepID=A0A8I2YS22_9AGAM|nr:hypothetical protein JVT61DRAFT_2637 [Boletus reticuloceps]